MSPPWAHRECEGGRSERRYCCKHEEHHWHAGDRDDARGRCVASSAPKHDRSPESAGPGATVGFRGARRQQRALRHPHQPAAHPKEGAATELGRAQTHDGARGDERGVRRRADFEAHRLRTQRVVLCSAAQSAHNGWRHEAGGGIEGVGQAERERPKVSERRRDLHLRRVVGEEEQEEGGAQADQARSVTAHRNSLETIERRLAVGQCLDAPAPWRTRATQQFSRAGDFFFFGSACFLS